MRLLEEAGRARHAGAQVRDTRVRELGGLEGLRRDRTVGEVGGSVGEVGFDQRQPPAAGSPEALGLAGDQGMVDEKGASSAGNHTDRQGGDAKEIEEAHRGAFCAPLALGVASYGRKNATVV